VTANALMLNDQLCSNEVLTKISEALYSKLNIQNIFTVELEMKGSKHQFSSLFQIKSLLGMGSFGLVLEVLNLKTNEVSALKILHREDSNHKFKLTDETMEQQVLQDLKHDNIILFKRITFSLEHVFIEMEVLNGGTLEDYIDKQRKSIKSAGKVLSIERVDEESEPDDQVEIHSNSQGMSPFPKGLMVIEEEQAAKITKDICMGLTHIHKMNYIHRDLKPENILLHFGDDGAITAKIADFGLTTEVNSNVFQGQDKIDQITGTILYMAPEQATGQRYGKRVDMWAIGIITFQMLTGKHPFYISNDDENTYTKRISQEPNLAEMLDKACKSCGISDLAADFIKKLLSRGISDRYRVYQALAHPWITRRLKDEIPMT
jgi:serine/threonine protein kinase